MRMDEMILVSVDDHMVEPPDMYKNHVPAKWAGEVPKVRRRGERRGQARAVSPARSE